MVASLLIAGSASAVTFEWATVGDPWNPADGRRSTCCGGLAGATGLGSVSYVFQITVWEVTNAQYAEFLNAVAAQADPYALWPPRMSELDAYGDPGGIVREGAPGGWSYVAMAGLEEHPVRWMNFYRAARFANWLHNGQPDDSSATEDGAYALLGGDPSGIVRQSSARFSVPTEDEWYKAGYYSPSDGRYRNYPTRYNAEPLAVPPPGGSNSANNAFGVLTLPEGFCFGPDCWLVATGSYPGTRSPYGVEDMAGGTMELTETSPTGACPGCRVARGGHYRKLAGDAYYAIRNQYPERCDGCWGLGFRLVQAEPTIPRPCGDGLDNDGDGWIDAADPGCPDETGPEESPQCQDGVSNDADGLADFDGGQSIHGACADGTCPPGVSDPDADGLADPDPECVGAPWRNREKAKVCGLGFEIAGTLVVLRLARSRRERFLRARPPQDGRAA
jgi:formylglycine-generating enzyme required for sulfatase activity